MKFTMLGGPLDGQEYEVRFLPTDRKVVIRIDSLKDIYEGPPDKPIRTAAVPVKFRDGKFVALWEERENG